MIDRQALPCGKYGGMDETMLGAEQQVPPVTGRRERYIRDAARYFDR